MRTVSSRVLSVLDAFTGAQRRLSLTEISRRTGMPMGTAHRLVGELVAWGALERDGRGRYQIGLRLWEVAALAPRGPGLREVALPFLEDLYEATHQHVQLAVLDGMDVVYVERISGRGAVGVRSRVGGRWPAHTTGVGLVLLAHADPQVQEDYLETPLAGFTELTITDPAVLRRVLADVRRTGYAVSDRQVTMDAISVAAPVRAALGSGLTGGGGGGQRPPTPSTARPGAADGAVVAGLSVVVGTDGPPASALIPAVVTAARGISRLMFRHPEGP
jgi:DNA-binding IclR family transcriptional regulator